MEFTEYAYTVTLQPKYNDFMPDVQVTFITNDMNSKSEYVDYDLRFELTKQGNIHAHGTIRLKRIIFKGYSQVIQLQSLFRDKARYHIGFVCVKDLIDVNGWYEYITKDEKKFKESLPPGINQRIYTGEYRFRPNMEYYEGLEEPNDEPEDKMLDALARVDLVVPKSQKATKKDRSATLYKSKKTTKSVKYYICNS